jgi:hypothetical protein
MVYISKLTTEQSYTFCEVKRIIKLEPGAVGQYFSEYCMQTARLRFATAGKFYSYFVFLGIVRTTSICLVKFKNISSLIQMGYTSRSTWRCTHSLVTSSLPWR